MGRMLLSAQKIVGCLIVGLIGAPLLLGQTPANEPRRLQILFLGDHGPHHPADLARRIVPVLKSRGIDLQYTEDVSVLTAEQLKPFDGLLIYANIDEISPAAEKTLLDYVASGKAFIPLHCATYCFRNSEKYIELCGAQFANHGGEEFITHIVEPSHPIMQGFGGFKSWDETYVHSKHNTKDRVVLEVRRQGRQASGKTEEPWTWVRTHGQGRVFYTAWGHDDRTWSQPGFHNLLERGIRWACKMEPSAASEFHDVATFPVPKMTEFKKDVAPFSFSDVGAQIPNYTRGARGGTQSAPLNRMQDPLPAEESAKHFITPEGFHMELWASEPQLASKPISMNWDERGRLWVCETVDYPNELQPRDGGRDRIRICEDSNGDGKADKFTVFAEKLSIPTAIVCYRGGVIVQDGRETVYLKDIDGDDRADFRQTLITGWVLGDTHGGVSNFQYGLDNWIWAMQGYNASTPVINGQQQQGFKQGFWRFQVLPGLADTTAPATWIGDAGRDLQLLKDHTIRVSQLEFLRATDNNTWGLGLSEEGLVFGSTANNNPSDFMPFPNRYYERVGGWAPETLKMIANTSKFAAVTDKVRQVDWHGAYTAAAGHALYTARRYPKEWWNRVAFVCEPTGHLIGTFVLDRVGAGYSSTGLFNLLGSDDEWSAPIMAEVGPDGNVWIIDWYNYIVQHNPTPRGFRTGRGNAYESELRDKSHGRIYRLVYDSPALPSVAAADQLTAKGLSGMSSLDLVKILSHPTMLWRKAAQRLIVEKGNKDERLISALIELAHSSQTDETGLAAGPLHALWTLEGLGLIAKDRANVVDVIRANLKHASPAVRRAAIQVLPKDNENLLAIFASGAIVDSDSQVRLAAILKISDVQGVASEKPADSGIVAQTLGNPKTIAAVGDDRWLLDAWTSAAAMQGASSLTALLALHGNLPLSEKLLERLPVVTKHLARSRMNANDVADLLVAMERGPQNAVGQVLTGLASGWPKDYSVSLNAEAQLAAEKVIARVPLTTKSQLVQLSELWGIKSFREQIEKITSDLFAVVSNTSATAENRIEAAKQIVAMQPLNADFVIRLLAVINPQTPPLVSKGLLSALTDSRADNVAKSLIQKCSSMTPDDRATAVRVMLSRTETTLELLQAIRSGTLQISDLQLDQRQALSEHRVQQVRALANQILQSGGSLPNPDRLRVLEAWMDVTNLTGDASRGKAVYTKHCAACHKHGSDGQNIGPNLTGIAVHPKAELLMNILDPSRSVEGNFRTYSLATVSGLVLNGMLAGESRTSVELIDAQGKRSVILREDIEQLTASKKSLMPEGFEGQIPRADMTDLLEFLTSKGRFLPLPMDSVATAVSTAPLFSTDVNGPDRLILQDWSTKTVGEVPFVLIDPQNGRVSNILMMNSSRGTLPPRMPKSVKILCNAPATSIHLLSGISGWGFPADSNKTVSLTVRLHYADGSTEDHELKNGEHFADYIRRSEVSGSAFAFAFQGGQQMRTIKIQPKRQETIKEVELIKGNDTTVPLVMAITLELAAH